MLYHLVNWCVTVDCRCRLFLFHRPQRRTQERRGADDDTDAGAAGGALPQPDKEPLTYQETALHEVFPVEVFLY